MATLQNTTIPNGGTLGSVGDPDAIAIASDGTVTPSSALDVSSATFTTSTAQKEAIVNGASGTNLLLPAGMISAMGMSSAPSGWLLCNGAAVSRSTYSALFAAIGTTWGSGDGSSTFNVPELKGAYLRNTGTSDTSSDYVGPNVGGYQDDQNATHNHNATSSSSLSINNSGNHSHNSPSAHYHGAFGTNKIAWGYSGNTTHYGGSGGNHSHGGSVSTSTSIGNSGSTEARVFNKGVQYCIKF